VSAHRHDLCAELVDLGVSWRTEPMSSARFYDPIEGQEAKWLTSETGHAPLSAV
jgi:hypothetical protein